MNVPTVKCQQCFPSFSFWLIPGVNCRAMNSIPPAGQPLQSVRRVLQLTDCYHNFITVPCVTQTSKVKTLDKKLMLSSFCGFKIEFVTFITIFIIYWFAEFLATWHCRRSKAHLEEWSPWDWVDSEQTGLRPTRTTTRQSTSTPSTFRAQTRSTWRLQTHQDPWELTVSIFPSRALVPSLRRQSLGKISN